MSKHFKLLAVAVLVLTHVPPVFAAARIYVRVRPPAPIVEARVVAPSPRHAWIPGSHRWDGHAHVWVSGRWELPPAHRRAWVAGSWAHDRRHGWYWIDGHWRR